MGRGVGSLECVAVVYRQPSDPFMGSLKDKILQMKFRVFEVRITCRIPFIFFGEGFPILFLSVHTFYSCQK